LDAIKNPQLGKNRLKGAVNKVVKAKKTAAVAGDFMSQMRDKMEARRAAMAGGPEDPAAARASMTSAASDDGDEADSKPSLASVRTIIFSSHGCQPAPSASGCSPNSGRACVRVLVGCTDRWAGQTHEGSNRR
jgi:hypothetical protein